MKQAQQKGFHYKAIVVTIRIGFSVRTEQSKKLGGRTQKPMNKLKLGIPKGSLQAFTIDLFKQAGYAITISGRS